MPQLEKYKRVVPIAFIVAAIGYVLLAKPLLVTSWRSDSATSNDFALKDIISKDNPKTSHKPLLGIDVSHDQGDVNWQLAVQNGVNFVYAKASDGITWQDPKFVKNVQAISALNVPVGPYHFFEAEDDPLKQAENYLHAIQHQKLTLTPMVDVEITRNQTPKIIKARLKTFLQTIHKATGCLPMIYSYKDYWESNIGPEFNHYPFWLADYAKQMNAPKALENLMIWQHSSTGQIPGIQVNVDLDILLGGEAALHQLSCDYSALNDVATQGAKHE